MVNKFVEKMHLELNVLKYVLVKRFKVSADKCSADNESRMKHEAHTCCMVKVDKRVEQ